MDALSIRIQKKPQYFSNSKILGNVIKLCTILVDCLCQGYFKNRKVTIMDFICLTGAFAVDYDDNERKSKSSTKSTFDIHTHLVQVYRIIVYCLNESFQTSDKTHKIFLLRKVLYHQVNMD